MEKYKVAAGLPRFVDHGHIVVYRVAHFVGGCGFDELPNSTAHGGTVVNNKESGPVCADRKSTRLNSSHTVISYAVFCLKKKKKKKKNRKEKKKRKRKNRDSTNQ